VVQRGKVYRTTKEEIFDAKELKDDIVIDIYKLNSSSVSL